MRSAMTYERVRYQVVWRVQLDLTVHVENFPVRRFQDDLLVLSLDDTRRLCRNP